MSTVDTTSRPDGFALPESLLAFESIGDNCELGLVQRRAGVEPMGLFRFVGAPLTHLLRAMRADFAGMEKPENVKVLLEHGEYMIKLTKYDFVYHAFVKPGEIDPAVLHKLECRKLRALIAKFRGDMQSGEKVFVFRQNEPLLANHLVDLRVALAAYGRSVLLWVQEGRQDHPPGTVEVIDDTLMVGYVRRLALRQSVPDLDYDSWIDVLRLAHELRPDKRGAQAAPRPAVGLEPAPKHTLTFGVDGNAEPAMGYGWSAPENGFTWAIEDKSLLTLAELPPAEDYWLELDVIPYEAPPAIPAQRLTIAVNGETVQTYDRLARGVVACTIPGALIRGRPSIEIRLDHPDAASPSVVAEVDDERRLAIAFRWVTLTCIGLLTERSRI